LRGVAQKALDRSRAIVEALSGILRGRRIDRPKAIRVPIADPLGLRELTP
jgi:hypothetical protein